MRDVGTAQKSIIKFNHNLCISNNVKIFHLPNYNDYKNLFEFYCTVYAFFAYPLQLECCGMHVTFLRSKRNDSKRECGDPPKTINK